MALFRCKNCNTIFEFPMELIVKSDITKSVCPTCKSHNVGKIAA